MPEQEQFGQAGVKSAAGLAPMPDAAPADTAASEPASYGSDTGSLREAAKELNRSEAPPEELGYTKRNERGESIGRSDDNKTIKLERGARDLNDYRERRLKDAEREAEAALRAQVDELRGQRGQPQQQFTAEQRSSQAQLNQSYNQQPAEQHNAQGYNQTDQAILTAAKDPGMQRNIAFTQQAIANRLQQLDQEIAQAYASRTDPGGLTLEFEQLYAHKENIDFVQRAQFLMQQGHSPRVATALADREVTEFIRAASTNLETMFKNKIAEEASVARM
jgi:hypothetical protein